MNVVTLAALPLVSLAAYVVWRAARGRPLKRYTLNGLVGLAVLVYFAITAALGVFWVANQELPVFDLHYLFGYLTLIAVGAHVWVNARPLNTFFRKSAPRAALTTDGRAWRPWLRVVGKVVGLALYGYACFWFGEGQGSETIQVEQGDEVPRPPPTVARPAATASTAEAPPTQARVAAPELPQARAARRQLVNDGDRRVDLATYYHDRTKHSRQSIRRGRRLDWSRRPHPFKVYRSGALIELPKPTLTVSVATGAAIEARRPPVHGLEPRSVTLAELSTLLHLTNGITSVVDYPSVRFYKRSAPSAGALYPTITYVLARSVEGLAPGAYHYDVMEHGLRLVRDGPVIDAVAAHTNRSHLVGGASFTLVFTTEFFRTAWKYRERSWRYSLLDAGHVAVNAMVVGAAMNLASAALGRFDDAAIGATLELDSNREGALLVVPFGARAAAPGAPGEPVFTATSQALTHADVPTLILLTHGRTALRLESDEGPVQAFEVPGPLSPSRVGSQVTLPTPEEAGDALGPVIERRRSERRWTDEPVTLAQLSSVLHHTFGFTAGHADPSVESNHALRLYVIALGVQDLPQGLYTYDRATHSLNLLRSGDYRTASYELGLFQEVVGESAVALVKTIDRRAMEWPDGSRGYRYATMDAGMVGGLLYLQTVSLNLGVTGIGAFFDDEVSEFIGVPSTEEQIIYMSVFGVPSPSDE